MMRNDVHNYAYLFPLDVHRDIDSVIVSKMDFEVVWNIFLIMVVSANIRMLIYNNYEIIKENSKIYNFNSKSYVRFEYYLARCFLNIGENTLLNRLKLNSSDSGELNLHVFNTINRLIGDDIEINSGILSYVQRMNERDLQNVAEILILSGMRISSLIYMNKLSKFAKLHKLTGILNAINVWMNKNDILNVRDALNELVESV